MPGDRRPAMLIPDMTQTVHLAIAQFHPRKGDYAGNLARLGPLFAQVDAQQPRPQVLVFPESALTGYFLEGGVREHAVTAGTLAADLQAVYREAVPGDSTLDVVIGFYESWSGKLHNSAAYVTLGGAEPVIQHVHRKMFLPTYGLFDEERFVERGRDIRAFDTAWGRAAILICEDAWHSMTATVAALDGAQVLFIPTAPPARGPWRDADSPGVPSSVSRWERLARDMADEHGVFVVLANLAGSEGGRTFPGAAMMAGPKGEVRMRGPLWTEALIVHTLDFGDVARARADQPLLADLEVMAPHLRAAMERVERHEPAVSTFDPPARPPTGAAAGAGARAPAGASALPVVNGDRRRAAAGAARDRPGAHRAVAGRVPARRDPATRVHEGRRRRFRRRGLGGHGVPRCPGAGSRERDRRAHAVPHVEPREQRPRPAGDRRTGHRGAHRGHQRRRGRLPPDDARRRRAPAAATSWRACG